MDLTTVTTCSWQWLQSTELLESVVGLGEYQHPLSTYPPAGSPHRARWG